MIAAAAGSQAWGGPAGRPPQSLVVGHGLGPGPGPGLTPRLGHLGI